MWVLFLIIITGAVFTFMRFGSVAAERVIFENSYQKQAGDKKQMATWQAQLAKINSELNSGVWADNPKAMSSLKAQKAMLEVQIKSLEMSK